VGSALHVILFLENLIRALLIFNGLRSCYCQRALLGYHYRIGEVDTGKSYYQYHAGRRKTGLGANNHLSAVVISRSKRRAGGMGKNPQFGSSVRRGDCERLACQFDSPRLTAVDGEPGLRCPPTSPSTVALAPRCQLSTRHTTVSVWKGTPEVRILLAERDGGRCQIKRKGWLVERQRARQRAGLPLPLVAFEGVLCARGVSNGRIRLGYVQRLPMVAD
jgi:hypothetical protein